MRIKKFEKCHSSDRESARFIITIIYFWQLLHWLFGRGHWSWFGRRRARASRAERRAHTDRTAKRRVFLTITNSLVMRMRLTKTSEHSLAVRFVHCRRKYCKLRNDSLTDSSQTMWKNCLCPFCNLAPSSRSWSRTNQRLEWAVYNETLFFLNVRQFFFFIVRFAPPEIRNEMCSKFLFGAKRTRRFFLYFCSIFMSLSLATSASLNFCWTTFYRWKYRCYAYKIL